MENMSEFKGTKGKWVSDLRSGCCAVYPQDRIDETNGLNSDDDRNIYYSNKDSFYNGNNWTMSEEAQANAQLISKAPEMLEMLEIILESQDAECHLESSINDSIKKLIKEAKTI